MSKNISFNSTRSPYCCLNTPSILVRFLADITSSNPPTVPSFLNRGATLGSTLTNRIFSNSISGANANRADSPIVVLA